MTAEPPERPFIAARHIAPPKPRGVTHIVFTDVLPRDEGAKSLEGGKVILVNSTWEKGARRRAAIRAEMHRMPGFLVWPMLGSARIRRLICEAADWASSFIQHANAIVASNQAVAAAVAVVAVVGTGTGLVTSGAVNVPALTVGGPATGQPHPGPGFLPPKPVHAHLPTKVAGYLGVYEPNSPASFGQVAEFDKVTGHNVNLAMYYIGLGEQFHLPFAQTAAAAGAVPVIQMDPGAKTVAAVAAGLYDPELITYAREIHAWGRNVVIGFGHEMNGGWYPWGYGNAKPADWVAAWRHIVTLFRAQGDYNVTWLWTISRATVGTAPIGDYWPGASYVTWVGIDGYFYLPSDTFATEFGDAIARVRQITSDPILISETAASPPEAPEVRQIRSLFNGIRFHQILGFVWFDAAQHGGIYHQDWRLENSPAALRAFRKAAREYGR